MQARRTGALSSPRTQDLRCAAYMGTTQRARQSGCQTRVNFVGKVLAAQQVTAASGLKHHHSPDSLLWLREIGGGNMTQKRAPLTQDFISVFNRENVNTGVYLLSEGAV